MQYVTWTHMYTRYAAVTCVNAPEIDGSTRRGNSWKSPRMETNKFH